MKASGIPNIGAVADSTDATVTPAYLTPATNVTELTAVSAPRTAMRTRAPRELCASSRGAERAHGVTQRSAAASGKRIACAVTGFISASGGLTRTVETAQATEASVAVPMPNPKRSSGAGPAHGARIKVIPASVRSVPPTIGSVIGSSRNTAAMAAEPIG